MYNIPYPQPAGPLHCSSQLLMCLACGESWDAEGQYRQGYEPGEVEFAAYDGEELCPACGSADCDPI